MSAAYFSHTLPYCFWLSSSALFNFKLLFHDWRAKRGAHQQRSERGRLQLQFWGNGCIIARVNGLMHINWCAFNWLFAYKNPAWTNSQLQQLICKAYNRSRTAMTPIARGAHHAPHSSEGLWARPFRGDQCQISDFAIDHNTVYIAPCFLTLRVSGIYCM